MMNINYEAGATPAPYSLENKCLKLATHTDATTIFNHFAFDGCFFTHTRGLRGTVLFANCTFINCRFDRSILRYIAFHHCDGVIYKGVYDDYVVLATAQRKGGYRIHAGCRFFSLTEAKKHWARRKHRSEIRRAVEEIAVAAKRRVYLGDPTWKAI